MDEFQRLQLFRYFMVLTNAMFHFAIYFGTEVYTDRLLIVLMSITFVLLLIITLTTRERDLCSNLTPIVIALGGPMCAWFDPPSRFLGQQVNAAAILVAYIMINPKSVGNIILPIANIVAWFLYWWDSRHLICVSDKHRSEQPECIPFLEVMTHSMMTLLLIIECTGFIKYQTWNLAKIYELERMIKEEERKEAERKFQEQEFKNAELKKSMEMNDAFLMSFSHELKNPLNALLGSIELAVSEKNPEDLSFLLSNAKMSGQILLNLLINVLDSGKIQTNKLDIHPQSRDFPSYLESFWGMASTLIKSKGLSGSLIISQDFPTRITFDKIRLSQILLNLVSNSLKFTNQGHIRIHVSFEACTNLQDTQFEPKDTYTSKDESEEMELGRKNNPRYTKHKRNPLSLSTSQSEESSARLLQAKTYQLDLNHNSFPACCFKQYSHSQEGFLRIEVTDTGCGMTKDQLSRLFKRYSQVNEDAGLRQIRTGLGLWISKELCHLMYGDIRATSEVNVGTSFVVMVKSMSLPSELKRRTHDENVMNITLIDQRSTTQNAHLLNKPSSNKRPSNYSKVKSIKIALVADDLVYNREIYMRMLRNENVGTHVVKDGAEAVEAFKNSPPGYFDFISLDINMPVLDGISAAWQIRAHEERYQWKKTPIFILTGHCSQEIREECIDPLGAVRAEDVLIKPVTQSDLKSICDRVSTTTTF